jgi:hypothetical protein
MPDPTKVYTFFDDFNEYTSSTDVPWIDSFVNSTSIAVVADEPFGAIILTNTGAENDHAQLQWQTENFTIASGKKAWFKSRFKVSDATQSDFVMGLAVHDTSLTGSAAGDGATDGIFFYKDDGSTSIKFTCQKDTTTGQATPVTVGTCGTAYMVLGWEYDGARTIKVFLNDVHVGTMDLSATPSTYLPNTPIAVSFAITNGEGAIKTMTVDYVFAAVER